MNEATKLLVRELKAWKRDFDALGDRLEVLEEKVKALKDAPAPPAPTPAPTPTPTSEDNDL